MDDEAAQAFYENRGAVENSEVLENSLNLGIAARKVDYKSIK